MENSPSRQAGIDRPEQSPAGRNHDPAATQLSAVDAQVRDVLQLDEGWNGFGSRPVDRDCLTTLLGVLAELDCIRQSPPNLVPLSSGGIQAEWHHLANSIEISIDTDLSISVFATSDDNYELAIEQQANLADDVVQRLTTLLRLHQAK